ncbi:MAG: aminotransferase class I/II-fold pyridoxal phosphate-dependent enzyme [Actinomycetota bacterium]|nr:aminotransferase class I/II-fold pyridoxal phosphate-dependent enzyme [Actinomycetota bacterium]
MTDPLDRLRAAGAAREQAGLTRRLLPRPAVHGLLDLSSNDYLGLARDPRVAAAAARGALTWGAGATGSRVVSGSTALHAELESALAAFAGAPAALVFSSGYLANLGVLAALGGPDVVIVSDAGNHASIVDGCRLSRSRVHVTPHADPAAAEAALADRVEEHALVVTDAVFSVDGDLAPLPELHDVARRHGALLVVDEAHSFGVVGSDGAGAVSAAGLAGEPDVVRTVTLSKALAAQGGAVLAAPEVIATLVDGARAFLFDTALAPASAAGALAALEVLAGQPGLAGQARVVARYLAGVATDCGFVASQPAAAVLSATLLAGAGRPADALRAAQVCRAHGVLVGCFRPPSVPEGRSCLRITARADLTNRDLTRAMSALRAAAAQVRVLPS